MSNGTTNGTPDPAVTQKQLLQMQIDWTEKLYHMTAEMKQDISEVKENIAKMEGRALGEDSEFTRNSTSGAHWIWIVTGLVNFAVAIAAMLLSVHV